MKKRIACILLLSILLLESNVYANTIELTDVDPMEEIIQGELLEEIEEELSEEMEEELEELLDEMEEEIIEYEFDSTPNYEKYIEAIGKREKVIREFDLSQGIAEEVPVILYHHLLKDEENPYINNTAVLDVDVFDEQIKYLYTQGFTTLTLYELEQFVLGEIEVPKKSVVITFDDGYSSNFHYAYPILKRYDFNASMFLITHKIPDETQEFSPERTMAIGWDQLTKASDVFEYANHTHDLHKMNEDEEPYLLTKSRNYLIRDLEFNKEITKGDYFAYPYGKYNTRNIDILEELGYSMAFTTNRGYVRPGDPVFELNRFGIFPSTNRIRFMQILHGIG